MLWVECGAVGGVVLLVECGAVGRVWCSSDVSSL